MLKVVYAVIIFSSPLSLNSIKEKEHYLFSSDEISHASLAGISDDKKSIVMALHLAKEIEPSNIKTMADRTYYVFADGNNLIPSEWDHTTSRPPAWLVSNHG